MTDPSNTDITFYKYHGTGNDFILINAFHKGVPDFTKAEIERICDRRLGVGGDGFILLERDPDGKDFSMKYYNADGLPGSMCGNGGRCAVQFALDQGIITRAETVFSAFDGPHTAWILDGSIKLQMAPAGEIRKITEKSWFTDTGSPHHVEWVIYPWNMDVETEGAAIRHNARYQPGGTNVNFMSFLGNNLEVRTFERGVESETMSCGTGVVACALVVSEITEISGVFYVKTPGGDLEVEISEDRQQIFLTGPAVFVFQGNFNTALHWMSYDNRIEG